MRIGIVTSVRLLGDAIALSLAARDNRIRTQCVRHIDELRELIAEGATLELVIVDTTQPLDLQDVRAFHRDHDQLPLLALGLSEREAEVVAHGSAGFACYLRREDGLDRLCTTVEDALAGRLDCSPEIAAAIMRGLFHNAPTPVPQAAGVLTPREDEVAQLVSCAMSNKEIARELRVSESTVKHHVHSILGKLGFMKRGQLMRSMRPKAWPPDDRPRMHG